MKSLENVDGRVHGIQVDVTDRSGMEKAAAEFIKVFGKVHVLVNVTVWASHLALARIV
jgi:NAD(P)-dependent dehydrogenase (short-subunit alcohol dehydrogenase family)